MSTILVRRWSSGDWVEVIVDGETVYEGHSVPDFIWEGLLEDCGVVVSHEEVVED